MDEKIVILSNNSTTKADEGYRGNRLKEKTYAFDFAFDESTPQTYVFKNTTKFLIEGII
jgi:hypothetical protein